MSQLSDSRRMSLTATVVAATLLATGVPFSSSASRAHGSIVSRTSATAATERSIGYVAYWDQARGLRSLGDAGGAATEVSPSWYAPAADGSIVVQDRGAVDDSPIAVAQL